MQRVVFYSGFKKGQGYSPKENSFRLHIGKAKLSVSNLYTVNWERRRRERAPVGAGVVLQRGLCFLILGMDFVCLFL